MAARSRPYYLCRGCLPGRREPLMGAWVEDRGVRQAGAGHGDAVRHRGGPRSLDPAGLKYEMGDFDGYAVEIALQLVEKAGSGEVVVISLGPDGVQEILRKALAMGADPRGPAQGRRGTVRRAHHRAGAGRRAQGRRLRSDPLRPDGHRHRERHRGPDGRRAARSSLRHRDLAVRRSRTDGAPRGRDLEGASETVTFPLRRCSRSTKASPGLGSHRSRASWRPRRSRST